MKTLVTPSLSGRARVLLAPAVMAFAFTPTLSEAQQAQYYNQPGYGNYQPQKPGFGKRVSSGIRRLFYGEPRPAPRYNRPQNAAVRSLDGPPPGGYQSPPPQYRPTYSAPPPAREQARPAPVKKAPEKTISSKPPVKSTPKPAATKKPVQEKAPEPVKRKETPPAPKKSSNQYTPPRISETQQTPPAPVKEMEPVTTPVDTPVIPPAPAPTLKDQPPTSPIPEQPVMDDAMNIPLMTNTPSSTAPTTLASLGSAMPGSDLGTIPQQQETTSELVVQTQPLSKPEPEVDFTVPTLPVPETTAAKNPLASVTTTMDLPPTPAPEPQVERQSPPAPLNEPAPSTQANNTPAPEEEPQNVSSSNNQFLVGTKTSVPGRVKSPYPPYQELDVSGLASGSLALDPTTDKVFEIP